MQKILPAALLSVLAACSGEMIGDPRPANVDEVLAAFGVDLTQTPRTGVDGEPLPESSSPLGSKRTVGKFDEIILFGVRLAGAIPSQGTAAVIDLEPGAGNTLAASLLHDPTDTPWSSSDVRSAAAGDFDGDGAEEIGIVYQVPNEPVKLVIVQDQRDAYALSAPSVVSLEASRELVLTAGDFDGDADVDLAVAIVLASAVRIVVLENQDGWTERTTLELPVLSEGRDVQVALEVGNIDQDDAIEVAVMIGELDATARLGEGTSRYFVYDDATTDFTVLRSGPATIVLPTESVTVKAGDIELGDVDGDGLDEIIIGGMTAFGNTCSLDASYVVEVLDDRVHDLAPLAAGKIAWIDRHQPCSSGANHQISAFHLTALDLDGDGAKELQANELIFDDLRASPVLTQIFEIPQSELFTPGTSGSQFEFSRRSTAFAAGDVTKDKREDLVFYAQRVDANQALAVWGLDAIDGFSKHLELETVFSNPLNSGGELAAQVLLPDLDMDLGTMALEYSTGSHRLVFTEPILIAALAAAPCSRELGQNEDACRTAFGKGVSETTERTDGWSVTAGVSVGFENEFSVFGVKLTGAEAITTIEHTVRGYTTSSYGLTTQVLRETGALEDSVIFATIPLDLYTYTILSHPDPGLVGSEVQVRLPRDPVTILTTREFYNGHVEQGAVQIDESIFKHVAGDPLSYRSAAEKNGILATHRGLESDQVDVGEGGGSTTVSITEFEETTTGESYETTGRLDVRATAGIVVAGFTVGGGGESALSIRRGAETIYQGSVGNIRGDLYPAESYSFGLFCYLEEHASGQTFEVLDYWVQDR